MKSSKNKKKMYVKYKFKKNVSSILTADLNVRVNLLIKIINKMKKFRI